MKILSRLHELLHYAHTGNLGFLIDQWSLFFRIKLYNINNLRFKYYGGTWLLKDASELYWIYDSGESLVYKSSWNYWKNDFKSMIYIMQNHPNLDYVRVNLSKKDKKPKILGKNMKIRIVKRDDRSDIRQCEECKKQGKDGVFLTLGFFNGFVCNDCAYLLGGLLQETNKLYIPLAAASGAKVQFEPSVSAGVAESSFNSFSDVKKWEENEIAKMPKDHFAIKLGASTSIPSTKLVEQETEKAFKGHRSNTPQSRQEPRTDVFSEETMQSITSRLDALEIAVKTIQANGRNRGLLK